MRMYGIIFIRTIIFTFLSFITLFKTIHLVFSKIVLPLIYDFHTSHSCSNRFKGAKFHVKIMHHRHVQQHLEGWPTLVSRTCENAAQGFRSNQPLHNKSVYVEGKVRIFQSRPPPSS